MLKIAHERNGRFIRVPEHVKALFRQDEAFFAEEDRDNFDYVYRTRDLVNLAGRKYDGKRNLIKNFKKTNEYSYYKIHSGNSAECLEFEEAWCSIKDCDHIEGLNNEKEAIKDMVKHFSEFNLISGAIKIKEKIKAIAIAEKLNDNTMVMHVLKGEANMKGLYQTMLNEFLSREGSPFEYINMEQDLGIGGIRKAKLSYYPCKMIKKYIMDFKK